MPQCRRQNSQCRRSNAIDRWRYFSAISREFTAVARSIAARAWATPVDEEAGENSLHWEPRSAMGSLDEKPMLPTLSTDHKVAVCISGTARASAFSNWSDAMSDVVE
jgi:hypothetical protein